jgi:hypothetical protein
MQSTLVLANIAPGGMVLSKTPLDALRYLTNQWTALQRFVEDGRLAT